MQKPRVRSDKIYFHSDLRLLQQLSNCDTNITCEIRIMIKIKGWSKKLYGLEMIKLLPWVLASCDEVVTTTGELQERWRSCEVFLEAENKFPSAMYYHQESLLCRHLRTGVVYKFHFISIFNNSVLSDKSFCWRDKGMHVILFFSGFMQRLWIAPLILNARNYCCSCVLLACSLIAYILLCDTIYAQRIKINIFGCFS